MGSFVLNHIRLGAASGKRKQQSKDPNEIESLKIGPSGIQI